MGVIGLETKEDVPVELLVGSAVKRVALRSPGVRVAARTSL